MSYDDDLEYGDRQMIATFGRPVRPPGADADNVVLAVFDEPYTRRDMPEGGFIREKVITLTIISADMPGIQEREVITVPLKRGYESGMAIWTEWTGFTIREIQPDGAGLSVIYLDPLTASDNSEYSPY
ncbi:head-tail joining protein [Klebsiella aerogenes]|uniref:head-tail joining protein n=1 Tax=Klebsiella aerogenes TaxID=548 RepID=UPI001F1654AB|nr:hypothetical protein [Klebsiella aerogenes]